MKNKANILTVFLVTLNMVRCTHYTQHDTTMAKSQEDYKAIVDPADEGFLEPEIPPVLEPKAPAIHPDLMQEVSLNITKDISIPHVFQKIAEQADINVLIAKNVRGSVIYRTKGQPLYQAIENLCEILNLRYTYENGLLKVERDTPYLDTYDLQFLAVSRKSQMDVSTNTQLFSRSESKDLMANNGSSTKLNTLGENDFWEDIKLNLQSILRPRKPDNPKVMTGGENQSESVQVQPAKKKKKGPYSYFTLNKQSGLISVFATQKQHQQIGKFINRLRRNTTSQILIEAKVVEVNLKEEFKSGIDWATITKGDFTANARLGNVAKVSPTLISNPVTTNVAALGVDGKNFSSILNFMESFGTTRTLSSPRLTVLNNQTALLKVAENHVFFSLEYDRHYATYTPDKSTTNNGMVVASRSTIQSVPIGFVMAVQPAIDQDTEEIVINLRPTISRVIGTKADPSVAIINNTLNPGGSHVDSEVPVVAVREIDSVMKLKSGQVAILGGLMIEGSENADAGLPGTGSKGFSFLTRAKRDAQMVTELVIFIKATIVKNQAVHGADHRLYKSFTRDPRPL